MVLLLKNFPEKLHICIAHLSLPLQDLITDFVSTNNFSACFTAQQVTQLLAHYQHAKWPQEQLCRDLIPLAQSFSLAPISDFNVGAVAMGISGRIYLGANMEFSGTTLAQTVHAEQSVITNAWLNQETQITTLAISAPPCGHCRQFINELNHANTINVLITNEAAVNFSTLLPLSFGPSDLGINDRLMISPRNNIELENDDELIIAAFNGAVTSYSPFSQSPSGIAIQTPMGVYVGRYAENCAYNPSLSPLQGALIALHLAGDNLSHITRAVLVESSNSDVSHFKTSDNLLSQISKVAIELVHCN